MNSVFKNDGTFIVAELSANHGGHLQTALDLVREAKQCGADAVKIQTYTPDTITLDCDNEYFQIHQGTIWDGSTLYRLYQRAYTPWEWHLPIQEAVHREGMVFFSTPFDFTAVDFLESLKVPIYKIASFELVDLPLIRRVAQTGKPLILSTGMATLAEIDGAVRTFREAGGRELALLKCTSAYPARPEEMNLRTIPHLAVAFRVHVGLSDHSLSIAAPVAAVTLGASIIEKHLTLDRSEPGPDSAFSLEPKEFQSMVEAVRTAELALGRVSYEATENEKSGRLPSPVPVRHEGYASRRYFFGRQSEVDPPWIRVTHNTSRRDSWPYRGPRTQTRNAAGLGRDRQSPGRRTRIDASRELRRLALRFAS